MSPIVRLFALSALTFSLFVAACGEEDEDRGTGPKTEKKTNHSMLTAAKWRLVGHTADPAVRRGEGVQVTDLYAEAGACVQDDVEEYKADSAWSWDNGAQKCNGGDPQTRSGTWFLFAQDPFFMQRGYGADSVVNYKIHEITDSTLQISAPFRREDGLIHTETFTYEAVK